MPRGELDLVLFLSDLNPKQLKIIINLLKKELADCKTPANQKNGSQTK